MLYAEGTANGITLSHEDRELGVKPKVFGNIIAVPDGCGWWTERNGLTLISKDDAQALYDTYMDGRIAAWDSSVNNPVDAMQIPTPARQTLP